MSLKQNEELVYVRKETRLFILVDSSRIRTARQKKNDSVLVKYYVCLNESYEHMKIKIMY